MSRWFDYFPHHVEYPEPAVQPLVPGVCFAYISTTFLNGWINYVEIDQARLVTRYRQHDENVAALEKFIADNVVHSELAALGDDVHLLARGPDGGWWWFQYDRDVSDATIGRLLTTDDDATVRAAFDVYVAEVSTGSPLVIPTESIRGWVSG